MTLIRGLVLLTDQMVFIFLRKALYVTPAPEIKAKDTLGAGDVWHGAFAVCLAKEKVRVKQLNFPISQLQLNVQNLVRHSSIPTRTEINEFINSK